MKINIRSVASAAGLAAAAFTTFGFAPAAEAAALTPSTVTIQANGTDLFGQVTSTRAVCEANRTVVVFRQVGTRGGGDDVRFASDSTDSDGDWNTGNTGTEGKFYAKVRKNTQCQGDSSPTILASR